MHYGAVQLLQAIRSIEAGVEENKFGKLINIRIQRYKQNKT